MARYLVLWEVDISKAPENPKERGAAWNVLLEMVKQDVKSGITKDWGTFVGETNGYSVMEGTEVEVSIALQKYVPYCKFKVHPLASVSQVAEVIKALMK